MSYVFFAALKEKQLEQTAISSVERINYFAGAKGYVRLDVSAQRTDIARNSLVNTFMELAKTPDDKLVMLDYDHDHPMDIIDRLVKHDLPVVGALAFRRGEPFFPCVFFRGVDGIMRHPETWEPKVYQCDAMGTAAIAIKKSVFDTLLEKGIEPPWFQYAYPPKATVLPSEDIYFSRMLELAAIPMYCDMGLVSPHLHIAQVDAESWKLWLADHPTEFKAKCIEAAPVERIYSSDRHSDSDVQQPDVLTAHN